MAKHKIDLLPDTQERSKKRKKAPASHAFILTIDELQRNLSFRQEFGEKVKEDLQSLRAFFRGIAPECAAYETRLRLLQLAIRQYVPGKETPGVQTFIGLTQMWHLCLEKGDDNLASIIASVFVAIVRAFSKFLELNEDGLSICRYLLSDRNITLFQRHLDTLRHKPFMVDPALRLLNEITCFGAGQATNLISFKRAVAWKHLDRFLSRRGTSHTTGPVLRDTASLYLYSNLQYQDTRGLTSFLGHAHFFKALLRDLPSETPATISKCLSRLSRDVVTSRVISHRTKRTFFSLPILSSISSLYADRRCAGPVNGQTIQQMTHSLLQKVCRLLLSHEDSTASKAPELDNVDMIIEDAHNRDQSQNLSGRDKLLLFFRRLRPYADLLQAELILECFSFDSSLIEPYFEKESLPFDPKLSITWLGYSRFLLSIICIPNHEVYDTSDSDDLLSERLLSRILPRPLQQKNLTRCLTQSISLITLIVVRLLVAAVQRFKSTLDSSGSTSFRETLRRKFILRVPHIRSILPHFWRRSAQNSIMQEAVTHLIALYCEVLPQLSLDVKMDTSSILVKQMELSWVSVERQGITDYRLLTLQHLIAISLWTPDTRWLKRLTVDDAVNASGMSPFSGLLKLAALHPEDDIRAVAGRSIVTIIPRLGLYLQPHDTKFSCLLIRSIFHTPSEFVPDLLTYIESVMLQIRHTTTRSLNTPELNCDNGIQEFLHESLDQWTSLHTSMSQVTQVAIAKLLGSIAEIVMQEDTNSAVNLTNSLNRDLIESKLSHYIHQPIGKTTELSHMDPEWLRQLQAGIEIQPDQTLSISQVYPAQSEEISIESCRPKAECRDHPELIAWKRAEVSDALNEGLVASVILCVSSLQNDVRIGAMNSIDLIMHNVLVSQFPTKEHVYMLLGELAETFRSLLPQEEFPHYVAMFATRILDVIMDPLHVLYTKASKFLLERPSWQLSSFLSHWANLTILEELSGDEGHEDEVAWILDVLFQGLRCEQDMLAYHRSNCLHRIFAIAMAPSTTENILLKIITLLVRFTLVGGSYTLIHRYGIIHWIDMLLQYNMPNFRKVLIPLQQLRREVLNAASIETPG